MGVMSALYGPKGGTVGTQSGELASAVVQPRQGAPGGLPGGLLSLDPKIIQSINVVDAMAKAQQPKPQEKPRADKILGVPTGVFFIAGAAVLVGLVWFVTRKK